MHKLPDEKLREISRLHGTPLYVYSLASLRHRADILAHINMPYGLIARYAAKANMNPEIIKLFLQKGLHFDASSSYEAAELVRMGVEPHKISLSSQQPAHNLDELLEQGMLYTATSLHQLELFMKAKKRPGRVGLRVNPGVGDGGNNRTTTGGPNSSFGLWHEYIGQALAIAKQQGVSINRLHIHYGSGASVHIWEQVIDTCLATAAQMPDVTSVDIGGGFKVSRYEGERETDLAGIAAIFKRKITDFAAATGRELQLEIEPGTWLVAHAGTLLAEIVDIVDTGEQGRKFLRLNTGMNDLIRPTMYGAQHEIAVLNDSDQTESYIVVGHNCETGDILTPAPGNSEELAERTLRKATIGDLVALYDTGAYGRSFAVTGYNSFPSAQEVCVEHDLKSAKQLPHVDSQTHGRTARLPATNTSQRS